MLWSKPGAFHVLYVYRRKTLETASATGVALCAMLILAGLRWPYVSDTRVPAGFPFQGAQTAAIQINPLFELLKLMAAALSGLILTAVHSRCQREKPLARSIQHAQVLLCVAAAMMMIIIGDSIARALGIAGGASIIRFRTPVEDPKDATVFLLLLGLGMAAGMGAFAVVGIGTLFLGSFLLFLDNFGQIRDRSLILALVAEGPEFPAEFVHRIFNVYGVEYEPGEVVHDRHASTKYKVRLPHGTPLDDMSAQLMAPGTGLRSLSWEKKDKK